MEDLPLGRIAVLVPEFGVKDLPLGRTLMMMMMMKEKKEMFELEEEKNMSEMFQILHLAIHGSTH